MSTIPNTYPPRSSDEYRTLHLKTENQPILIRKTVPLVNPGIFERIDWDVQKVLLTDNFDGVRLELRQAFGPTVLNGILQKNDLDKGISYSLSNAMVSGDDLLFAQFDHNSRGTLTWNQQYTGSLSRWAHRINATVNMDSADIVANIDRKGDDHSLGFTVSRDLLGVSFFQALTPNVDVGGKVQASVYPSFKPAHFVGKARYHENGATLICAASTSGMVMLSGLVNAAPGLLLASEAEINPKLLPASRVTVGAQYSVNQAKVNATVNSNGIIQATIQDVIGPMMVLKWSATHNAFNGLSRFGFGVQLG